MRQDDGVFGLGGIRAVPLDATSTLRVELSADSVRGRARWDVAVRLPTNRARCTITIEGDRIGRLDIAAEEVPGIIDELPAIAALAGHGAEVSVRGAAELRVKETDRIAALVAGLRGLGISADERPDGFVAGETGRSTAGAGEADARGDHRMAMAFAIAALAGPSPSRIIGADSVVISYPGFFETLGRLVA